MLPADCLLHLLPDVLLLLLVAPPPVTSYVDTHAYAQTDGYVPMLRKSVCVCVCACMQIISERVREIDGEKRCKSDGA